MAIRFVKIGLVQMGVEKDPQVNLEKALYLIRLCAKRGANIVCLPELFTTPYFAQVRREKNNRKNKDKRKEKSTEKNYCEKIPGITTYALSECAKANKVVIIAGSIYEQGEDGKRYNTSVVFGEGGKILGKYRKIHIPQDECFYEKDYFAAGNLGFRVFKTQYGKIAPLICYDQWYPEAARINALMGADIVFYPTAIGTVKGISQAEGNWQAAWENVMRGHAIANGMVIAAVNRCGTEGKMEFWGGSFVCNAWGKTIVRMGKKEGVAIAKVDLEHGKGVRKGWKFFANRRPDQYKRITER